MVCAIRFGKLKKTWAVISGDAMFLLLVCSGDLDTHVLCGGCSSTIVCFCIMYKISTHVVCVNGKHPGYT